MKPEARTGDGSKQTSADSAVRIYCAVFVSPNLRFSVGRVFECPDFEFELDFDRQKPHSTSGENPSTSGLKCPESPRRNHNKYFCIIFLFLQHRNIGSTVIRKLQFECS